MTTLETVNSIAKHAGTIPAGEFNRISEYEAKGDHDHIIRKDPGYCWYFDPADGTSDLLTGNHCFVVSIGLTLQGESILCIMYYPVNDEQTELQ